MFTYEHNIYEFSYYWLKDLRLKILGNWEKSGKSQNVIRYSLVSNLPAKIKFLLTPAKAPEKQKLNFSRSELFRMKIRIRLKYFQNYFMYATFFSAL